MNDSFVGDSNAIIEWNELPRYFKWRASPAICDEGQGRIRNKCVFNAEFDKSYVVYL